MVEGRHLPTRSPLPARFRLFRTARHHLLPRLTVLLLLIFALGLLFLHIAGVAWPARLGNNLRDLASPFLTALMRPVDAVYQIGENTRELVDLRRDNQRLLEENESLRNWQSKATQLDIENQQLRQMLHVLPEPTATYRTARVIGEYGSSFSRSLMLNAGLKEGLSKGDTVLYRGALVGRIQDISARSARVLLLTDINSHLPVLLADSKEQAVLAGDNSPVPKLLYLDPKSTVKVGDRVVTSGRGGGVPPGLEIGVVSHVFGENISVKLTEDNQRLTYVTVVNYNLAPAIIPILNPHRGKQEK
ncbi:MAG: rod shape-determining protein MreC [Dongiaceae bacterium]